MVQIEEHLAEEIRKYDHLYNPSLQMAYNSWKEISANVGLQVDKCTKLWWKIRDKFVRQKKAMRSSSGDAGGKKVPAFYLFLSWLGPHIKHWATSSNYDQINIRGGKKTDSSISLDSL